MDTSNKIRTHDSAGDPDIFTTTVFTVGDRIHIGKLYPQRTDLAESIVIDDLRQKLRFDQDEIEHYGIEAKTINGSAAQVWKETDGGVKFGLTKMEVRMLKKNLDRMSQEKAIGTDVYFIGLCRKLMDLKPVDDSNSY